MLASEYINKIANLSGTNEKIEMMANVFAESDIIKNLFYYAESPRFVYGMKKVEPVPTESESSLLDGNNFNDFVGILKALAYREITGNRAKNVVNNFLESIHPSDQEVCCNVIKKDMRCAMGAKNINKAFPGLVELPPPYQRCSLENKSNYNEFSADDKEFFSQEKMDGMFLNLFVGNNRVESVTRSGELFPIHKFKNLYNSLVEFGKKFENGIVNNEPCNGVWFAGEVVLSKNGVLLDRKTSNGICNSIMKDGSADIDLYELHYFSWDYVPEKYFTNGGCYDQEYGIRFHYVKTFMQAINNPHFKIVESKQVNRQGAQVHYKEIRQAGGEGTVVKNIRGIWEDGTSKDCVKMKAEVDIDMRIIGLTEGKGKRKDKFGAVLVESECKQVQGKISGMSDEMLDDIFNNFEEKWNGTIVSVTSNELVTAKGRDTYSLFLPRWNEPRFDKTIADDLERIKEIFASVL